MTDVHTTCPPRRMGPRFARRGRWIAVLLGALAVFSPCSALQAGPIGLSAHEVVTDPSDGTWTTKPTHISPEDLAKLVKDNIPTYQSIATLSGNCNSEIYVDALDGALTGTSIATGASAADQSTHSRGDEHTGYINSLITKLEADADKTIKAAHDESMAENPFNPDSTAGARTKRRIEGWDGYRGRQDDPTKLPTGRQKYGEDGVVKTTGAGADGIKLKNGTDSNHAILFTGSPTSADRAHEARLKKLFADRGFDSVRSMMNLDGGGVPDGLGGTAPNPDWATKDNLEKALKDLAGVMNDKEHLVLVLLGHTAHSQPSARTTRGSDNQEGEVIESAMLSDIIPLDEFLWYNARSVGPEGEYADEPNPTLYLRTNTENFQGPALVDISLNGIPVGAMELAGHPDGSYYTLELPDSAMSALFPETPVDQLQVQFALPNPTASFQLTTEADLANWPDAGSNFGLGLLVPHLNGFDPGDEIPEPATLVLSMATLLALAPYARRRRRAAA